MINEHNEAEIDGNDSQQLQLKADFEKNEIRFEYYYSNIDDFSSEKEINYLNKFLKAAKFNQKKCLKPAVGVYHATLSYSEIICGQNFNFMSSIVIRR